MAYQPINKEGTHDKHIRNALKYTQAGSSVMGQAAVDRARAGGMSDQDIRDAAFFGRFKLGAKAYQSLFGSGKSATNTMGGKTIHRNDGTVSNVSGPGIQNWGADTLDHMKIRRQQVEEMRSKGKSLDEIREAFAALGYQPANSFAELGDQRWYSQPVTNEMKIAAAKAAESAPKKYAPKPSRSRRNSSSNRSVVNSSLNL